MSRRPRTSLLCLLTAGATAAVVLPVLAQPAQAVTVATEVQVVLRSSPSGDYGIYSRPVGATDAATDTVLVAPSPSMDYTDLTTSADGSRFAYVAGTFRAPTPSDPSPDPVKQVVVRDIGGNLVRVADQVDPRTTNDVVFGPALSPDGGTLVWGRAAFSGSNVSISLRKVSSVGGAPVTIPGGSAAFDIPTFLTPTTLIFIDRGGVAKTLPVNGGTATKIDGVDGRGPLDFEVSPDGTKLAWSRETTPVSSTTNTTYDVRLADLSTAGTPSVSNVTTFSSTLDNEGPSFSSDSSRLSFVQYDGDAGDGEVVTGPVNGSTPPKPTPITAGVDEVQVDGGTVDTIAPASAPTPGSFTLGGKSATLRWTLPTEADVSGIKVSRNGGAAVFRPGSSFTDTGLTLGTTYSYTAAAVDRSGNVGPTSTAKSLVATAPPTLAVADPTAKVTTGLPFKVAFAPTGNKVGTVYDVYYRNVATSSGFSRWATTTGTSQTFGYRASPVPVAGGNVFQLRGAARDSFGNATGYLTSATKAVVPFDQTKALFTKDVATGTSSDRFLGSVRILSKTGQHAVLTVAGDRLQIIGERGTSGGSFDVYRKSGSGTYVRIARNISTYASSRQVRQTLFTGATVSGTFTYDIRWVPGTTSTRKLVILDAFGVRR